MPLIAPRRIPVSVRRGMGRIRSAASASADLVAGLRRRIPAVPVVPPAPPELPRLPPEPVTQPVVRTRWPHFLSVSVGLGCFVVAMAGVHAASEIIGPIFLALNLVIASHPLHDWLRRRGLPAAMAATLTGLLVIAVIVAFFGLLGWAVAALVLAIPPYVPKMERLYLDLLRHLEDQGITQEQIVDTLQEAVTTQWQSFAQEGIALLQGVLANLTGVLSLLLVLITVLFFLTMDTVGVSTRFDLIREASPHAAAVLKDFARGVRRYWIVTTIFGLIVALLDTWVLVSLGVPLALVWGVFSFLTNYIPNIGFVIGLIPPAILALLERGPTSMILVVVAYSLLNFVIQSLIQPKVAGDAVGVTPTVSVVSLLVWTWVLGPLGALLALPATLLVKAVLIDGDRQAGWVSYLLASSPESQRRPGHPPADPTIGPSSPPAAPPTPDTGTP